MKYKTKRVAKNISNCFKPSNFYDLSHKYELSNLKTDENAAFYPTRINLEYIYSLLPEIKKDEINILEPSVGAGKFIIPIFKKYQDAKLINLYLCDIDNTTINWLKDTIKSHRIPKNFNIIFICDDYIKHSFDMSFDLIVGNPPFLKLDSLTSKQTSSNNIFELFFKKSIKLSTYTILILPKLVLQSPTYKIFRNYMKNENITDIIDFGEEGFKNVKIETIVVKTVQKKPFTNSITIISTTKNILIHQEKSYIFSALLPYWIIYRNNKFDDIYYKMKKDIFNIYKKYEISNSDMTNNNVKKSIWVIRSKNIDINEPKIIKIENYDKYISDLAKVTKFYNFLKSDSDEFREFYSIAFSYSTRTLNIDSETIKFFGDIE